MAEQILYFSKNIEHYSVNLKKMIVDIADEMTNGIKDGFGYRMGMLQNDEVQLHALAKKEGYDISYKEFSSFLVDAKESIELNADFIDSVLSDKKAELATTELSDDDLEKVAGGKLKWWQIALICVAAVALVVACVFAGPIVATVATAMAATSGVWLTGGAVAVTVVAVSASASLGAAATVVVAAGATAVVAGGAAAISAAV